VYPFLYATTTRYIAPYIRLTARKIWFKFCWLFCWLFRAKKGLFWDFLGF